MAYLKNIIAVATFLLNICVFISCSQQPDKNTSINKTLRIPVSVKDSMILSIDRSPMDMIYFPEDYPKQKMITPNMDNPIARAIYSRPQKNGRVIFSDTSVKQNIIQYYGQDWRLGANEATEIEFFKPVSIAGNKVAPGRYIMYCIPYKDKWKIILNKNLYSWGLHIDKAKDLIAVELPVIINDVQIEFFTMLFQKSNTGCDLIMAWGKMKVLMPINF